MTYEELALEADRQGYALVREEHKNFTVYVTFSDTFHRTVSAVSAEKAVEKMRAEAEKITDAQRFKLLQSEGETELDVQI